MPLFIPWLRFSQILQFSCLKPGGFTTGSPSSKYEHRRTPALLRNIRNIRICMGKKPIVSVTYENERNVTIDARYAREKNFFFFDQGGNWHLCRRVR